jgi:hypothetical protein
MIHLLRINSIHPDLDGPNSKNPTRTSSGHHSEIIPSITMTTATVADPPWVPPDQDHVISHKEADLTDHLEEVLEVPDLGKIREISGEPAVVQCRDLKDPG